MNNYNLDLNKFKEVSSNLHAMVQENPNMSRSQMLQALSQSLFSKPYEEVKETILKEDNTAIVNFLFSGQHFFIFVDKKCLYSGTEKLSYENALRLIQSNKKTKNWSDPKNKIHWSEIPHFIDGKGVYDDHERFGKPTIKEIMTAAQMIGYFSRKSLINLLQTEASSVLIDGMHCPYLLNGDWEEEILEPDNDIDMVIWHPEIAYQNSFYEWYFTLSDLANAVYDERYDQWIVSYNGRPLPIKIISK